MREPELSDQGLSPTHEVAARDQYGDVRTVRIAGERPLTLKVDEREVVTLMTLGMPIGECLSSYTETSAASTSSSSPSGVSASASMSS